MLTRNADRSKRQTSGRGFTFKTINTSRPQWISEGKVMVNYYEQNIALRSVLQEALENIKLSSIEIKDCNELIDQKIKNGLISKMTLNNSLFKKIFKDCEWSGSFYNGLKITRPDEFDILIVMKLPFPELIVMAPTRTGFLRIQNFDKVLHRIENCPEWEEGHYKILAAWCDNTGCLLADKVRSWLESLIDDVVLTNNDIFPQIKRKKSGPAITLVIENVSFDLVPAFQLDSKPPFPFIQPDKNFPWHVVPKGFKPRPKVKARVPTELASGEDKRMLKSRTRRNWQNYRNTWRPSFYQSEQELLKSWGNIKPAIRLVKALRNNTSGLEKIFSYLIVTVALSLKRSSSLNAQKDGICIGKILKDEPLEVVFKKLLDGILAGLREGKVSFLWHKGCNLLHNMHEVELENMTQQFSHVVSKIEHCWFERQEEIGNMF